MAVGRLRVVCGATHRCRWRVEGIGVAESSFVGDAPTQGSKAGGEEGGTQRRAKPQRCVSRIDMHQRMDVK